MQARKYGFIDSPRIIWCFFKEIKRDRATHMISRDKIVKMFSTKLHGNSNGILFRAREVPLVKFALKCASAFRRTSFALLAYLT